MSQRGSNILRIPGGIRAGKRTGKDADEAMDDLQKSVIVARNWRDVERERMRKMATLDINSYMEFVMKDEKGQRLHQEPLHISWWEFAAYARSQGRHCGIIAPFASGKSYQFSGGSGFFIGRWPEIRIKVICNAFDLAKDTVSQVRRIIDWDEDYRTVFPDVRSIEEKSKDPRRRSEEWSGSKFRVRNKSFARDATMQAFGILSTGAGRRMDLGLIDDPCDFTNAIQKPALRPQVLGAILSTWTGRLSEYGFLICITTVWHTDDAVAHLKKNTAWAWLEQAVTTDKTSITSRVILPGWGEQELPPIPAPGDTPLILEREEARFRGQEEDLAIGAEER